MIFVVFRSLNSETVEQTALTDQMKSNNGGNGPSASNSYTNSAEDPFEEGHREQVVDTTAATRGMWLVKVPKYLADEWMKSNTPQVGKLKTVPSAIQGGKPDVVFTLSDSLAAHANPIARSEHKFIMTASKADQSLFVFSQGQTPNLGFTAGSLACEGHVIQRAECRPTGDRNYFESKRAKLEIAKKEVRPVIQLSETVRPYYKPVARRDVDIDNEARRKSQPVKSRSDREVVVDVLLKAFQKHQYYNIKDLVRISNQPLPFLKEVLNEYCNYNHKPPHRNMWELKPQFRHYDDQPGSSTN